MDRFLQNSFQFFIRNSSYLSTLHSLETDSAVNQSTNQAIADGAGQAKRVSLLAQKNENRDQSVLANDREAGGVYADFRGSLVIS
jgi:hypothetical protein